MNVIYQFLVDFARPYKTNTLLVMQSDSNTREMHFILLENGRVFDMEEATAATVTAVTPSGKTVVSDASIVTKSVTDTETDKTTTINTNEIVYTVPAAITAESGKTTLMLTILGADGKQISSFEFYINVRNELYSTDNYSDTDDLTGFRDLLNRSLAALKKVETMTESTSLPNPYPLRVTQAGKTSSYNGSQTVEIDLNAEEFEGTVTLTSSGWKGDAAPYTQSVTLKGLMASKKYEMLSGCTAADAAGRKAYAKAYGIVSQGKAEITDDTAAFTVWKKPATDVTLIIRHW